MKQVKFIELEEPTHYIGGILTDNGDVICGCCGGVFVKDEWDDLGIVIITEYNTWINLDKEIMWS